MAKYRVEVAEPADSDLRDIAQHISSQLAPPMTAAKMMDAMEEAIAGLAAMPQKCLLVTDDRLVSMGYRKLVVKSYVVFFTIDEKSKVLDVERVLFGRRAWLRIL